MLNKVITFDSSLKRYILSIFGKRVDGEGYIIEEGKPTERAITPDGEEVREEDFAGLHKGSLIFVRSGIISTIKLSDRLG